MTSLSAHGILIKPGSERFEKQTGSGMSGKPGGKIRRELNLETVTIQSGQPASRQHNGKALERVKLEQSREIMKP